MQNTILPRLFHNLNFFFLPVNKSSQNDTNLSLTSLSWLRFQGKFAKTQFWKSAFFFLQKNGCLSSSSSSNSSSFFFFSFGKNPQNIPNQNFNPQKVQRATGGCRRLSNCLGRFWILFVYSFPSLQHHLVLSSHCV